MTPQEFETSILNPTLSAVCTLSATKGKEYTQDGERLKNFKDLASDLGISPESVCFIFLKKHIDAIKSFVKFKEVYSEPIEGRIDDAILYLILLKALISENELVVAITEETGRFQCPCCDWRTNDEKYFKVHIKECEAKTKHILGKSW